MVAAIDFGVNRRTFQLRFESVGNQKVVDSPASVLLTCTESVAPIAVSNLFGV